MNSDRSPELRFRIFTGLILLLIRGVVLWLLIPLVSLFWIFGWFYWRRRRVSLGQMLGWADINLIAAIQRGLLRPLIRYPSVWTPISELPTTTHRIRCIDPV